MIANSCILLTNERWVTMYNLNRNWPVSLTSPLCMISQLLHRWTTISFAFQCRKRRSTQKESKGYSEAYFVPFSLHPPLTPKEASSTDAIKTRWYKGIYVTQEVKMAHQLKLMAKTQKGLQG
uniref:Uncharacterized protein n=1 Tax=Oryza brachyantha TaxID=4533 RepID=J3M218_ORYBR